MNKTKPLDHSDICVDHAGRVGLIGSFNGGKVQFYYFDADGNTGEATDVDLEDLTRAPLDAIPPNRRAVLADVQWNELGHE